jgi:hypothetical protein
MASSHRSSFQRATHLLGSFPIFVLCTMLAIAGGKPQRTLSSFGYHSGHGEIVPPLPNNAALGLFDPDPLQDVAIVEDGILKVYRNLGNGLFDDEPLWQQRLPSPVKKLQWQKSRRIALTLADPMSWGDLQLEYQSGIIQKISHLEILAQGNPSQVRALKAGTSTADFQLTWQSDRNPLPTNHIVVGDLDNDGRMNLAYGITDTLVTSQWRRLVVYECTGNDQYTVEWDTMIVHGFGGPYCISDLDQDGQKEIVLVQPKDGGGIMTFLECRGPQSYTMLESNIGFYATDRGNAEIFKAFEADFNHNGVKELVVLNSDGSASYDATLIYEAEIYKKFTNSMVFSTIYTAREQSYCFDMAVGQVDGQGCDEIVPGNGGFGFEEPLDLGYLWWDGTTDLYAWRRRTIHTGLFSGSTAPMFTDLDGDGTQDLLIGGVGPIGFGSMFALKYQDDSTWSVLWADSSLRNTPLDVNVGYINGTYVAAGANSWGRVDTEYTELHAYRPSGEPLFAWKLDSTSMHTFSFLDIDNDGTSNIVFVNLHFGEPNRHCISIYEVHGTVDALPSEPPPRAESFQLLQNYPNPFNGETSIRFQLPEAGRGCLVVYDILGREVLRLGEGVYSPGAQIIHWNGKNRQGGDVASGLYLYRLEFTGKSQGQRTETRKMILIR